MNILKQLFAKKDDSAQLAPNLMTAQYAAYYAFQKSNSAMNLYLQRLTSFGFSKNDALKMLRFESDVILKFDKQYLLDPD